MKDPNIFRAREASQEALISFAHQAGFRSKKKDSGMIGLFTMSGFPSLGANGGSGATAHARIVFGCDLSVAHLSGSPGWLAHACSLSIILVDIFSPKRTVTGIPCKISQHSHHSSPDQACHASTLTVVKEKTWHHVRRVA
jgi:hypothetical protein